MVPLPRLPLALQPIVLIVKVIEGGQGLTRPLDVFLHLLDKSLARLEGADLSQVLHEVDSDFVSIYVFVETQKVQLDGRWRSAERRPGPDVKCTVERAGTDRARKS